MLQREVLSALARSKRCKESENGGRQAPCCSETAVLSSTQEYDFDLGISLADELNKVRHLWYMTEALHLKHIGIKLVVSFACELIPIFSFVFHVIGNVHKMYTKCTQNVRKTYAKCTQNVRKMYARCTQNVRKMYTKCTRNVHKMYAKCTQNIRKMYIKCTQNVHKGIQNFTLDLL
jgi:hypothetical protein